MTGFILDANDLRRKQDDPLDTAIASVTHQILEQKDHACPTRPSQFDALGFRVARGSDE